MKTISTVLQDEVFTESNAPQNPLATPIVGIHTAITRLAATIKLKAKAFCDRVMQLVRPSHTYRIVHIEHLHNSCSKMDSPKRNVFFLYVKGYSMNEISSISGRKRRHIIATVHGILNTLHKDTFIS